MEKPEGEEVSTTNIQTAIQESVEAEDKKVYDTIIVGGAGAALTAAIYAARRAMKTLVIMKSLGGQAAMTDQIENYPGFLKVGGIPLMQKFLKQATKSGAEILTSLEVKEIIELKKNGQPEFLVKADSNKYRAKTVILAFGKTPRNLDVPGEDKFGNKGVSYCAICDLPLFANKIVAVVGGGNSALDAATYAAKICKKVYLIHRRDDFRGFEYLIERAKSDPKIEILYSSVIKEIKGDTKVHSVVVQDLKTNQTKEISVDGVFVEIGSVAKTGFIKNLVKLDNVGQVVITRNCETFYPDSDKVRPGIFAAGDLTTTPFKQIVVSAGEGCIAALQAYNYLHGLQPTFVADWTKLIKK